MLTSSARVVLKAAGSFGNAEGAPDATAGSFRGECFRATCRNPGADWHHGTADRYYCADCAADINLACKLRGEPPICNRRR